MKKIITLFPLRAVIMLLTVLPSMVWAYDVGPWTFEGCRTGTCDWGTQTHQSYNGLNNTHWDVYQWNSPEQGVNFLVQGDSYAAHQLAVFAHFSCTPMVPAYTCMHLKWTGKLMINAKELTGSVAIYKGNDKNELLKRQVDFSEKLWAAPEYKYGCIAYLIKEGLYDLIPVQKYDSAFFTETFDFDNSDSEIDQYKYWGLLRAHVVGCQGKAKCCLNEWASFSHKSEEWTYTYYKHVSFDPNGGVGTLQKQKMGNGDRLQPNNNTMTRPGFVFNIWNTQSDGSGTYYHDMDSVSTAANDKGDVTLYAQWIPVPSITRCTFEQKDRKVRLQWTIQKSNCQKGSFHIYRDTIEIATIPFTGNNTAFSYEHVNPKDENNLAFPYESMLNYKVMFVPVKGDATTIVSAYVNTSRSLPIRDMEVLSQDTAIVFKWESDGYDKGWGNEFDIYIDKDKVQTIIPALDGQKAFQWEHRSVHSHSDRQTFYDPQKRIWYLEEAIDACSAHTYTVKSRIGQHICDEEKFEKTAITEGTKFVAFEASKASYAGKVKLSWQVDLKGALLAKTYTVERRLADSNDPWTKIEMLKSDADYITYTDDSPLTGVFYEYRVTVEDKCADGRRFYTYTTDIGFAQTTGTVSGRITYGASGMAVPDADVVAKRLSDNEDDHQHYALFFNDPIGQAVWDYPDDSYANSVFKNNPWSVQLWIKPETQGQQTFLQLSDQLSLGMDNDNHPVFGDAVFTNLTLTPGQYNHLTLTRTGKNITCCLVAYDDNGLPRLLSGKIVLNNLDLTHTTQLLLGGFTGYIDEFRLWTKALTTNDILHNYDRILSGSETALETYWTFDEGLYTDFFDYSRNDAVFHGHHGRHGNNLKPSHHIPAELALKATTDADGNYIITGIPFDGEGDTYAIIPSLGIHQFNPTQQLRFVSNNSLVHNATDFTDISSFSVSGTVFYEHTDYPVEGCSLYVDGTLCSKDGQAVTTNSDGQFTISVPIGEHFIQVKKDGHTFLAEGRYPADINQIGTRINFNNNVDGLTFYDATLVNFTGRVVGGNIESAKPIGFGLSHNNIGIATIALQPQLSKYRLNVVEVKEGTVVRVDPNTETLPVSSAQPDIIQSHAWRGEGENCSKIWIKTDSLTGEFSAMLPPLPYVVNGIRIASSNIEVLDDPLALDLSDPLIARLDSAVRESDSKTIYYAYHTLLRQTYHSEPVFTVQQINHPDGSFGIDSFDVIDQLGTLSVNDIHVKGTDGKINYNYGAPLFISMDTYQFAIEAYEKFFNMDTGDSVFSHVPMANAKITADNQLAVNPSSIDHQFELNEEGKTYYSWQAGMPLLAAPYTRTLNIYYGETDALKEGLSLTGIVLGVSSTGNNFVTSGPVDVDMILRDPPGSQSFTEWTKGTVSTRKIFSATTTSSDTTVNHSVSLHPELSVSASGEGYSLGGTVSWGWDIAAGGHSNVTEWTTSNSYTKSVSVWDTFSTSDSPQYDGLDGDVFIGTSTNIIIGDVRNLSLFRDGTDRTKAHVDVKDDYAQGLSFPTAFVYTQHQIINNIIPDLEKIRNSLLTVVPNTDSGKVNNGSEPIYITTLSPSDPLFGLGGTYTVIPPKNSNQTYMVDTISNLNMQIMSWKDALAANEAEKVGASKVRQAMVSQGRATNRSFDAGSSITETYTVEDISESSEETYRSEMIVLKAASDNSGGFSIFGIGYSKKETADSTFIHDNRTDDSSSQSASFSYTLRDEDVTDVISVDIYSNYGRYGSPIFHTLAGKTSNPYEGRVETKYFEADQHHVIMESTLQVERPDIEVVKATMSDVPSGSPANYELHLSNLSEAGVDCTFRLMVDDETNPYGAVLMMDGRPITDNNRLIKIPSNETVVKTLQLKQSDPGILHYEGIAVVLASQVQSDPTSNMAVIADTVRINAHFAPSSSPVTLGLSTTTLNCQTGTDVRLTMSDFDRNYYNLKAFRMQYKPQGGDWTVLHEFVLNESDLAGSHSELLPAVGATVSYTLPMQNYTDGNYLFRIVSVSTFGNEEVKVYSNEVALVKDMSRPRPLGLPEPTDGILDIGDELSVTFNEAILKNELTTSRNFLVTGVLNGAEVEHFTALRTNADTSVVAAKTEANINLSGKDFSLDAWINIHGAGTLLRHGSDMQTMEIATDEAGHLVLSLFGDSIVFSSKAVLPRDRWLFCTLSLRAGDDGGRISMAVAFDDETVTLFENKEVPHYYGNGPLSVGGGAEAAVHELLLWDEARELPVALAQRTLTKSPATRHLIGYWKMNEGEGTVARDYSRNRHMKLNAETWFINLVNKAVVLDGSAYIAMDASTVPPMPDDDYAIEFWFNAASLADTATIFRLGEVDMWLDGKGRIHLHSNGEDGIIDHVVNAPIEEKQWHHVALNVLRLGTGTVYIDGVRALTIPASQIGSLASDSLRMGLGFIGEIDEVRIWKATMTGDLLAHNRKIRLNGNEPGLMLYYPFEKKQLDEYNQVVVSGSAEEITGHGSKAAINGQMVNDQMVNYSDNSPALREKPTETNVPFSFTASDDKVVLSIEAEADKIEGCTLNFTVRDVKGLNGNLSDPVTWSAFVHRNELLWQDDELNVVQEQGVPSTLTTAVINRSGKAQEWYLGELPAWLTVSQNQGVLNPLEKTTLSFYISESTPIGKYERTVYLTGSNGIETPLTLHLTVTGDVPEWNVIPEDFDFSMDIIGQLNILGRPCDDPDDIVAAFVGNECRGIAHPQYVERYDGYFVTLTVYGDDGAQKDTLSFRVYDASSGIVYTSVLPDDIPYRSLGIVGRYNDPVLFTVNNVIEQRTVLRKGWNWLSVFVRTEDMTPQAVFEDVLEDMEMIKSHTAFAVPYQGIMRGSLTSIDNTIMYMVKMKNERTLKLVGTPVTQSTGQVTVASKWNWIGYYGQQSMSVTEAMAGMNPQTGDLLQAQRGVTYFDDYQWVGSLLYLQPGHGYIVYNTAEEKTFAYPTVTVGSPRLIHQSPFTNHQSAITIHQSSDPHDYPYNMILIAQVMSGNLPAGNVEIGVFDGEECRAAGVTDEQGFITLLIPGENETTLTFRAAIGEDILEATQTLDYESDAIIGSYDMPHIIRFGDEQGIDQLPITNDRSPIKLLRDGIIYILRNGQLYDLNGRLAN